MSWLGWTLVFLVVLGVLGSLGSKSRRGNAGRRQQKRGGSGGHNMEAEAEGIASGITTIVQYRALQRKIENIENHISESDSHASSRSVDNAYDRHLMLLHARSLVAKKTLAWQFVPELDLDTPMFELQNAYKVFSTEEHQRLRDTTLTDRSMWRGVNDYNDFEPDKPDSEQKELIKALKKFRTIVESDLTQEQKAKRINKLVSGNSEHFNDFFDLPDGMQPGDEWFAGTLVQRGLPIAYQLYSEGYTTPEKCLEIDPVDFSKRQGVGPEELEKLKHFQRNVKETTKELVQSREESSEPRSA